MNKKPSPTEQLCMNAMHELAQTKMIGRISVRDVLNATGISKATFYRHYTDKYDLYEKMLYRDVDHIFTDSCDLSQWQERIRIFFRHIQRELPLYQHMVRADPNAFTTFYTNAVCGLFLLRLERLQGKGYRVPQALHTRVLFMSAGMAAVLCDWIAGGCTTPSDALAEQFIGLFADIARGSALSAPEGVRRSNAKKP